LLDGYPKSSSGLDLGILSKYLTYLLGWTADGTCYYYCRFVACATINTCETAVEKSYLVSKIHLRIFRKLRTTSIVPSTVDLVLTRSDGVRNKSPVRISWPTTRVFYIFFTSNFSVFITHTVCSVYCVRPIDSTVMYTSLQFNRTTCMLLPAYQL